ncbi:putative uncharacterized protein [Aliivibrio wodanis]|uniref:Uncharacterized protein n=1 Tax=Aliivibrio wodanis TaxID=80852 RepID=A0A090IS91_9GAMM|nr:putative uncharacterized protein [Aliivibrio wodanis]
MTSANEMEYETLTFSQILTYIQAVKLILGKRWLHKKVNQEKEKRTRDKEDSNNNKFNYLYRTPPHQIVLWEFEFEGWKTSCVKSKRLVMTPEMMRYIHFGYTLLLAENAIGFKKVIDRLKRVEHFEATSFEVEVAAGYINKGYKVTFIEEGPKKTPDFEVIASNGEKFWVECKYKNVQTDKEKRISSVWKDLERNLLTKLTRCERNVAVIIKLTSTPSRKELEALTDFILKYVEDDNLPITFGKKITSIPSPDGKHQVVIQKLTEPGKAIEFSSINIRCSEDFDRYTLTCESSNVRGQQLIHNPIILGLIIEESFDNVKSVVNSFKSAVKQLPESGPSVIMIRIDDKGWTSCMEDSFNKAKSLLQNELSENINRRVNAVFIKTCRSIHSIETSEYKSFDVCVEHPSPRTEITIN